MVEMQLVHRTTSTPDYETGQYANTYMAETIKAVVLPVAYTVRQGEQRRPFEYGAYYDQQRRAFLMDLTLNPGLTAEPAAREWIVYNSQRYEIESVESVGDNALRFVGRQETEVSPTNVYTPRIRSKLFLEQGIGDT